MSEPVRGVGAPASEEEGVRQLLRDVQLFALAVDARGRVTYCNPYVEQVTGWSRSEILGRDWYELFPLPEVGPIRDRFLQELAADAVMPYTESPICTAAGERRIVAWNNVTLRDAAGAVAGVMSIGADVTERRRAERALRAVAEEQAALRRVATLVAHGSPPETIFEAVTEETARLFCADAARTVRFDGPSEGVVVGAWGAADVAAIRVGAAFALDDETAIGRVFATGEAARVDGYEHATGALGRSLRHTGMRHAVAMPIHVAGRLWGAIALASEREDGLSPGVEERLADFTALVAQALANAEAHEALAASRARIVEAGDAERRRLERNLHDGAQSRLVALSLALSLARSRMGSDPEALRLLDDARHELDVALAELRELARGIHPAILSDHGLRAALQVVVDRSSVPVDLAVSAEPGLPEPVEAAIYYVVSEALTNVVKYADATAASVVVRGGEGTVSVEISDDGAGGADPTRGSGLQGLKDRVDAMRGRFALESAPGRGTTVRAEIPV